MRKAEVRKMRDEELRPLPEIAQLFRVSVKTVRWAWATNVVLCAVPCYVSLMPRLSIDITPEEHQKLKAIAALKGESIKDFVLKRTLGDAPALDDMSEAEAVAALADFLKPRIEQARRGEFSKKSLADIRREAHQQAGL